jgi:glutamate carboxypeptidase
MPDAVATRLLAWHLDRRDEMVAMLRRLAEAESPTYEPESQRGPFAILAAELERAGYRVRPVSGHGTGDHLYAVPCGRSRSRPRQLLVGHMDTVWPRGSLETMPVHERDGMLYGPGVADMKGGLVLIAFALRALRELALEPTVTPVVLVNTDEEIGSPDSRRLLRLLAEGAERALVLECGEGPEGQLKIARKGIGRFTVTVHGRPSHAGADFEQGISAILELTHVVQKLFALNDPERGITVNVGTIDGGLRPNVVAPIAQAVVDVRVPTAEDARTLEEAIRSLRPTLEGATLEVTGRLGRPPMEAHPRNRALLATAIRLGHRLGLSIRDAGLAGGGSDANTTSLFTATLDGLGPIGMGSHAPDECIDVRLLPARSALLALLLLAPTAHPHLVRGQAHHMRRRPAPSRTGRIALVGRDTSTTNVELVAAWRALGLKIALVAPHELCDWLKPGDIVLGRLDVLPTVDAVEPGLLDLLRAEWQGFRVLNNASALAAAHDKLLTARLLSKASLPQPRTAHLAPGGPFPDVRPPLVLKPRLGSWGVDVVRCETDADLAEALPEVRARPWFRRRGALVQALVETDSRDLRLVVANGKVIGAARRIAAPGEWRTNISLGGTLVPLEAPADAAALGIAAAQAIGADLVGIDLLPTPNGYLVLELNGAADFELVYSPPGRDIFEDTARALGLAAAKGDERLTHLVTEPLLALGPVPSAVPKTPDDLVTAGAPPPAAGDRVGTTSSSLRE